MRVRRRVRVTAGVVVGLVGLALPSSAYAARQSTPRPQGFTNSVTHVIGVDNATAAGHNFEFTTFYPQTSTVVASGDVLDFKWNQGSPDGFHTVTFTSKSTDPTNPGSVWNSYPILLPDASEPAGNPLQNAGAFGPIPPTATCGTATSPCVYAGGSDISSGAAPTAVGGDYFVRVTGTNTTTYTFVCLIHPGMHGSVTIGATPTTAQQEAAAAASQYSTDLGEALATESSFGTAPSTTNADGTKTWSVQAGASSADGHAQVLEMLPMNLKVSKGDHVKYTAGGAGEVHTVTFPAGPLSNPVDPFALPPECDPGADTAGAGADTPPTFGPTGPSCPGGPASLEFPAQVGPMGPTTLQRHAYRTVASDGGVFAFGDAPFAGSTGNIKLNAPIVGQAATTDGTGYWNVGSDGGVFAFGKTAQFLGSMGGKKLNKPVVGVASTSDDGGYYEVASDGGIFNFGDAAFAGSAGALKLNQPVVGMAIFPNLFGAPGYWLVARDGGIFNYGAAPFLGSAGAIKLNKPIVGMAATPDGGGYWLVGSDGGVFSYGDAQFFGSTGAMKLNAPIVGIQATPSGLGYWLVASDGGIFSYGDAKFWGSTGAIRLNQPIVGMTTMPPDVATSGLLAPPLPVTPTGYPPSTYTYTIGDAGGYTYQCRIHDDMHGIVVAS